jgi:hypothetical protein
MAPGYRIAVSRAPLAAALLALGCASAPAPAPRVPESLEQRVARHFESLRGRPPLLRAFLREMPKGADLHNHLSGAVYAESLLAWAVEDGSCLDIQTLALQPPPCDASAGRPPASSGTPSSSAPSRCPWPP